MGCAGLATERPFPGFAFRLVLFMSTPIPVGSGKSFGLVVGALGVVYGDIGTSPLYTLRECFHPSHNIAPTAANILGVLSLIVWSLILLISIKYILFVMRADNKGEGGILSLLALSVAQKTWTRSRRGGLLVVLGVFGAALLYGDGMLTPAVTVLSAIEGLSVVTPLFTPYIIPITIGILVFLFWIQKAGTGKMGKIFGPITFLWFLAIFLLGLRQLLENPEVLSSVNPMHGLRFFQEHEGKAFVVLGSVFLAVTGGEALYADMGHFGRIPIRRAWFIVVLPALLVNYMGQGALLMKNPGAVHNPFYLLAPSWALIPLVVLATMAAVIASQALITGVFSLTMQAIQLGFCPRLEIDHTSSHTKGQIYIPQVNRVLMFSCIGLVIGFGSSGRLAAAYGIAVSMTMFITTILFYFAARQLWRWSAFKAGGICLIFGFVELAFFSANALKIAHGGWFPLVVAALIYFLMSTWKHGRQILARRLRASSLPLNLFLDDIAVNPPVRVKGTAIFMSGNSDGTPVALLHNLKHNKVLHDRVIILTVVTDESPHVLDQDRVEVEQLRENFYRVIGHFGFMEDPNVPEVMQLCSAKGLDCPVEHATYFLSSETILATTNKGMAVWREHLFAFMSRNSQRATTFFRIPPNRVVELGMQVEI